MARSSSSGSSASYASNHEEDDKKKKQKEDEGEGKNNIDEGEEELFEENKSVQEVFFMTLSTLSSEKAFVNDWRVNAAKIILEGLTGFLVVFNPLVKGWSIDTGLWIWQIITWAAYHSPVAYYREYEVYVRVMYVHVALVCLLLAAFGGLMVATARHVTFTKPWKKAIKVLQFCMDAVFSVLFMTIFSVFVFMLNCNFTSEGSSKGMHVHYSSVDCTEAPHLGHMVVGALFALLLMMTSVVLAVSDCELSPLCRYTLASPAATMRVKVVIAKVFVLVCAVAINSSRQAPPIIVWIFAFYIWWLYFRAMPFYNRWVSHAVSAMWLGIAYTAGVLMVGVWDSRNGDPDWHEWLTWAVLKGIFPVMVGSALGQWLMLEYKMSKTKKFLDLPPNVVLRKVHKFYWEADVELMSRVMRKFDLDGDVDLKAVELGEIIIKAGIAYFPNCPDLLVLYALVLLDIRHEGPIARAQLLAAAKLKPNIITRYQIFTAADKAKRLRSKGEGTMDLQSYVEFKRNYRMLARVHKKALKAQREFWKMFMHSGTRVGMVRAQLAALEAGAERAQYAYRKIMERYPNNGKVLKCYGKFLEEVKNDIASATKFYMEGNRIGTTDAMMNMDFDFAAQKKMDLLVNMNMHEDAVLIIDAVGTILMNSQGASDLFGYSKRELEGANVSMLMPQPFSQRHPSYLSRYTSTGEPHILDVPQQVVALHKEKHVFPVDLGVTKLSGTGADCIFLGVLKPCPVSMGSVRVWVSPSGFVLCCDQQFSGLVGLPSETMVGRQLSSLVVDVAGIEAFLERCQAAPASHFSTGQLTASMHFVNKYVPPIPATITAHLNGTNLERIFVFNVERKTENEEMMMVCDRAGIITFTTWDMAALIGVSIQKLVGSKLETLLPPPYNSMHTKWLQDTPPTIPTNSCRAGVVVQLVNSSNVLVPVRLRVHSMEENNRTVHVVRVRKVSPNEMLDDRRVSFTIDLNGNIMAVEPESSLLYGWPVDTWKGGRIADVVDLIHAWRQRVSDAYHGGNVERCLAESGTGGVKVLMLALIENELAHPGTSFRVVLKPPQVDFATANEAARKTTHQGATLEELLHNKANANTLKASRRAVMWPEVVEVDGLTAIKLHMYKEDTLTGYLEMETDLSIRKADMWASLILGSPSSSLTRQKLPQVLHVDEGSRWEDMMGIEAQMGGLTRVSRGTITAPRKFVADHADGGTVRIMLQGVSKSEGLGNKNRIEATLHTDTSYYQGSPHVVFELLGLDDDKEGRKMAAQHKHKMQGLTLSRHRYVSAARDKRPGSSCSTKSNNRAPGSRQASLNGGGKEGRGGSTNRQKRVSSSSGTSSMFQQQKQLQEGLSGGFRQLSGLVEGDEEGEEGQDRASDMGSSAGLGSGSGQEEGSRSGSGAGSLRGEEGEGHQKQLLRSATQYGGCMQGSDNTEEDEEGTGKMEDEEERRKQRKQKEAVSQWIQSVADFNAEDKEGPPCTPPPDDNRRSRAKPTLISIDEDGTEMMLGSSGSSGFMPRPYQPCGPVRGAADELDEAAPQSELAVDADWERQVADMPDEAAQIQAEKEAKTKGGKAGKGAGDQPAQQGDDAHSESSAGDGGTEIDGQSVASGNSARDEILVDFRRGRLLKKLILLTRGPCLTEPLHRLSRHSLLNILAIVVVHIIFFAVFMTLLDTREGQLYTIFRHGQAIDRSQILYYRALRTEHCFKLAAQGRPMPEGNICARADNNPNYVAAILQEAVEDYSSFHHDVFLGAEGRVEEIVDPVARSLWNDDSFKIKMSFDTTPPSEVEVEKGLWEVGNRLTYAGRELQVAYQEDPTTIGDTRPFYFVRENAWGPVFDNYVSSIDHLSRFIYDNQGELAQALVAFLILEAIVVLTLLHLYQLKLVVDVERARLGGMLALVGLPVPVLTLMHKQPLVILEDDSDEELEEEAGVPGKPPADKEAEEEEHAAALKAAKDAAREGERREEDEQAAAQKLLMQGPTSGGEGGAEVNDMITYVAQDAIQPAAPARAKAFRNPFKLSSQLRYNGKSLVSSWGKIFKLLLPFFLWQLAVLIVWAVTISMVEEVKGPIVSLALSMRVLYRFSHVRAAAITLIIQDTDAGKDLWREELQAQVDHLASEYDALLYGGVASSLEGTVFAFSAPAVAFESQDFKSNFFQEKRCFRTDQSTCLQPGHPFYEASQNGLDAMMRRMIAEFRLLISDDNNEVSYLNQRIDFMHQIGSNDITDGLQTTSQLFTTHTSAKFAEVQDLHIALLVITIILAMLYIYFALWPYEKAVKREATQVAGLLSHAPKEMDIRKHLFGALKKACP